MKIQINDTLQPSCLVAGGWTNKVKPMRKLLLNVKQSTAWRVLCRAYARWVEAYGNEGAAAFAYYLLLPPMPRSPAAALRLLPSIALSSELVAA